MAILKQLLTPHGLMIDNAYYELEYIGWSKGGDTNNVIAYFRVYVSQEAKLNGAPHITTTEVRYPIPAGYIDDAYAAIKKVADFYTAECVDV